MAPPPHQPLPDIRMSRLRGCGSCTEMELRRAIPVTRLPLQCMSGLASSRDTLALSALPSPPPSLTTCVIVASLLIQETTSRCKIFLPLFSLAGIFARICTPII